MCAYESDFLFLNLFFTDPATCLRRFIYHRTALLYFLYVVEFRETHIREMLVHRQYITEAWISRQRRTFDFLAFARRTNSGASMYCAMYLYIVFVFLCEASQSSMAKWCYQHRRGIRTTLCRTHPLNSSIHIHTCTLGYTFTVTTVPYQTYMILI